MDKKESIFDKIEGLTQVDPEALAEYEKEMTEKVIPEIVRIVEERRMLAAESRYREMNISIDWSKRFD
jgi:hypothetical protein